MGGFRPTGGKSLKVSWYALPAITGLAAALRFLGLFRLPPQAWVDEAWFALRAREILQTGQFPIFYKTFWGGVNPLLVWLTAGVEALFLPQALVASRAVSAASSLLAVPLLYAALSEFWRPDGMAPGRRRATAALAALLLAGSFSIVTLSRMGTEPALALAASLFCFWQQRRAVRTASWSSFVLAGFGAGAAQYISPHARFIPVVMGLWGLSDLVLSTPAQRRRLGLGYGLLAACLVLLAAPLAAFFLREPDWFFGRARAVTVGAAQRGLAAYLLENTGRIALAFSWAGDPSGRDNLPGRPLLDPIQGVAFYLGLAVVLGNVRRRRSARDLLAWLAVTVAPAWLTDDAPSFSRMALAAAPVAALAALGMGRAWDLAHGRLKPKWVRAAAAGLVLASLGSGVYDYFVRFAQQPDLADWYTAAPVDLARLLMERSRGEAVIVEAVPEVKDAYAMDFLLPGSAVRRLDLRQCLPLAAGRPTRTTYLVWSEHDPASVRELRQAFPQAGVNEFFPGASTLAGGLTLIEVPPGATARLGGRPAAARFSPGLVLERVDQSTDRLKPGESVFLTLYWRAESPLDTDLVPFTHLGTGLSGEGLVAQRDGQPCQGFLPTSRWVPGELVPDRFAITVPANAAAGQFPLVVGWYRYPSLERLALEAADQALPDNRAVIGQVTVLAP